MNIDFEPISSIADAEEVLAMIEIRTLFYPSTYVGDLEWDEDQLLVSFLETVEPATRAEYNDEPAAAVEEAKSQLLADLYRLISQRHGALKDNTPFEWNFAEGLLLQRRDRGAINAVGLGYLWLSLYWLLHSGKDYIVVNDADRSEFNRIFANVFELICCYAMCGQSETLVWYFGDSRSSGEFLRRLETVTTTCGTGVAKRLEDLEAHQVGTNDAGVDILAIEVQEDGSVRRNALAYLVGVTIQQASRRTKVMGIDQQNRFTGYFERTPLLAYKGILAVPFERSENDELTCRDNNCLYIAKDELIENLGRVVADKSAANLRHPGGKLLRATRALRARFRLADNGEGLRVSLR